MIKQILIICFLILSFVSATNSDNSYHSLNQNSGKSFSNYYKKIILYYLPGSDINKLMSRDIFKGFGETEIYDAFQETYFYNEPVYLYPVSNYQPDAYLVTYNSNNNKLTIHHKDTGFYLYIYYNKKLQPLLKYTFYKNEKIDTIIYVYKNNDLFFVKSTLYGYIYFHEPEKFLEKIEKKLREYFPHVF